MLWHKSDLPVGDCLVIPLAQNHRRHVYNLRFREISADKCLQEIDPVISSPETTTLGVVPDHEFASSGGT
jgi:hypothetical protein